VIAQPHQIPASFLPVLLGVFLVPHANDVLEHLPLERLAAVLQLGGDDLFEAHGDLCVHVRKSFRSG
jgi:hypothetical protein